MGYPEVEKIYCRISGCQENPAVQIDGRFFLCKKHYKEYSGKTSLKEKHNFIFPEQGQLFRSASWTTPPNTHWEFYCREKRDSRNCSLSESDMMQALWDYEFQFVEKPMVENFQGQNLIRFEKRGYIFYYGKTSHTPYFFDTPWGQRKFSLNGEKFKNPVNTPAKG